MSGHFVSFCMNVLRLLLLVLAGFCATLVACVGADPIATSSPSAITSASSDGSPTMKGAGHVEGAGSTSDTPPSTAGDAGREASSANDAGCTPKADPCGWMCTAGSVDDGCGTIVACPERCYELCRDAGFGTQGVCSTSTGYCTCDP